MIMKAIFNKTVVLQSFVYALMIIVFFFRDKLTKRAVLLGIDANNLIKCRITRFIPLFFSVYIEQVRTLNVKNFHRIIRLVVSAKISLVRTAAYFSSHILNHNTYIYSLKHSVYALSEVFHTPIFRIGSTNLNYCFTLRRDMRINANVRLWRFKNTQIT